MCMVSNINDITNMYESNRHIPLNHQTHRFIRSIKKAKIDLPNKQEKIFCLTIQCFEFDFSQKDVKIFF